MFWLINNLTTASVSNGSNNNVTFTLVCTQAAAKTIFSILYIAAWRSVRHCAQRLPSW